MWMMMMMMMVMILMVMVLVRAGKKKATICYRDGLCPRCASGSVGLVLFE